MRKLNLLMAFFMLIGFGLLTSCSDDETDDVIKPKVIVTEVAGATYEQGTSVSYGIVISSNEKLKNFEVTVSGVTGAEGTVLTYTTEGLFELDDDGNATDVIDVSTKSEALSYTYIVPATNTGDVTITFKVTDSETFNEDVKTFTIVEATPEGTAFGNEATNGVIAHTWGPNHAAFDLVNGTSLASDGNEANKDMKNVSQQNLDFVVGWEAGTGNTTTFVKVTGFDYDAGTVEEAVALFTGATSSVSGVAVNDVYLALLGNGETCAIKITEVNTIDILSDVKIGEEGFIKFSYKKSSVAVGK